MIEKSKQKGIEMKKIIAVSLLSLFAVSGYALTITGVGADIEVSYQEPATNLDGTPLDDLSRTTIYYSTDSKVTRIEAFRVTATARSGNGNIIQHIMLPILPGQQANFSVWATASDLSGNESEDSNTETIRIDRLAPSAPR